MNIKDNMKGESIMTTESFIKGLIIGGVAGLAVGILYAPKSGREIRKQLSDSTEEILSKAKMQYEDTRKKLTEIAESKKESYRESKERLKKAVDAGVEVYKHGNTEMHQS
jgi:gas vesicle protein